MPRVTRLSQALSEGDGISILVEVADVDAAEAAESGGADALAIRRGLDAVRASTQLPLLHLGDAAAGTGGSDAVVVPPEHEAWERARGLGVECVVRVTSSDDLERALEELDPELFLLALEPGSDEDPLEALLALLHDVPAGKLAIADLADANAEEVAELERAGVDGVLVAASNAAALVGAEPPEVP
jgi:indole-3-glycerol phosphate synthase